MTPTRSLDERRALRSREPIAFAVLIVLANMVGCGTSSSPSQDEDAGAGGVPTGGASGLGGSSSGAGAAAGSSVGGNTGSGGSSSGTSGASGAGAATGGVGGGGGTGGTPSAGTSGNAGTGGGETNSVTCGVETCTPGNGICCRDRATNTSECVQESACESSPDTAIITCDSAVGRNQCCLSLGYPDNGRPYLAYFVEGTCFADTEIRLCDPDQNECPNCSPYDFDGWLPEGYYACQ